MSLRTVVFISATLLATPAFAVKLHNQDKGKHDITVKCSSTSHRSIDSNTITDLGNGPCTVTIKSSGSSITGSGSDHLVIKGGKVQRK